MNSRAVSLAIVTGGGSDVGHRVCCRLAKEGYFVCVWDPRFGAALNAVSEIERSGREADAIQVDLRSADSIKRAAQLTVTEWGLPALLVNCAAAALSLDEQLDSASNCIASVSSALKDARSAIVVNIFPDPAPSHARERATIRQWTDSISARLTPFGVRVNSLIPATSPSDPEFSSEVEVSENVDLIDAVASVCSRASTARPGAVIGVKDSRVWGY